IVWMIKLLNGQSLQAFILDMDGVLWRGAEPIWDLPLIFSQILDMGCKVALATNTATRSIEQFVEKLHGFGVSLDSRLVINSAEAAAEYLRNKHPAGGPVYFVGEEGVEQVLD